MLTLHSEVKITALLNIFL